MTKVYIGCTNKEFIRKYKKSPESNNIVLEWRNSISIISQAADKSLGKCEVIMLKKTLKMWDGEIKLIAQQKNLAYKKYLPKRPQTMRMYRSIEEPLPKEKSEKVNTNPGNNLYHT